MSEPRKPERMAARQHTFEDCPRCRSLEADMESAEQQHRYVVVLFENAITLLRQQNEAMKLNLEMRLDGKKTILGVE